MGVSTSGDWAGNGGGIREERAGTVGESAGDDVADAWRGGGRPRGETEFGPEMFLCGEGVELGACGRR